MSDILEKDVESSESSSEATGIVSSDKVVIKVPRLREISKTKMSYLKYEEKVCANLISLVVLSGDSTAMHEIREYLTSKVLLGGISHD